MWYYNSPIGTMRIYSKSSRYALEINGIVYGSYHTLSVAADDVYAHATGCDDWDMSNYEYVPSDLNQWNYQ